MENKLRIIISGGGTGGHIFPAISIANAIKKKNPDAEILFVGASDRMEMEKVPAAGYKIVGLPVVGFNRKNLFKNITVIFKLLKSLTFAYKTIKVFNPAIVIGVGGYASGPTLRVANLLNIPTVIQEQNSYAGVTNKLLAPKASAICVAYDQMECFFPKEKIIMTGNPVRQDILSNTISKADANSYFGLKESKMTLLIIGGSLGARTINESINEGIDRLLDNDIQLIWQTGKSYITIAQQIKKDRQDKDLYVSDFITNMNYAYAAADLVVSRAGAGSISEFCLLKKPVILIPSPNVAEDHQTKNALALSNKGAAVLIKDQDAKQLLITKTLEIASNKEKIKTLSQNISTLALNDSADKIADIVSKIILSHISQK